MFVKDEYVFHESSGVCRVADIQRAPLDNMPADRHYYILHPVHDANSVLYVPVDSDRIFLRRLLNREEADALLDQIAGVATIEEPNAKLLRARYVEAMSTHMPLEWVRVIKTVYRRATELGARSQRLSETERSMGESAKRHLHTELALALGLSESEMEQYITDHIQKMA